MKTPKLLYSAIVCMVCLIAMQSCQKEVIQSEKIKELTIDTTISYNSTYYLDLSPYCTTSQMVTIIDQAKHFSVSRIDSVEETTSPYYTYATSLKNTGTDKITLAISDLDDGRRILSKDSTIIYINLTIK